MGESQKGGVINMRGTDRLVLSNKREVQLLGLGHKVQVKQAAVGGDISIRHGSSAALQSCPYYMIFL